MDAAAVRQLGVDVIERESAAVASVAGQLDDTFVQVVQALLECKGKVLVSGSGTSHAVALRFAHLLSCVGTPALFLHPGDSQHGASGAVAEANVLDRPAQGRRDDGGHLPRGHRPQARRHGRGHHRETRASSLGRLADIVLHVTAPTGVDPFGMVATGSSLFNSAFCDAICVALLELRGYSVDDFGETHPGGAVGHKIKEHEAT